MKRLIVEFCTMLFLVLVLVFCNSSNCIANYVADYINVEGKIIEMKYQDERYWIEVEPTEDRDGRLYDRQALKYDDEDTVIVVAKVAKNEEGKEKITERRTVYLTEKEYKDYKLGQHVVIPRARVRDSVETLDMTIENLAKYNVWLKEKGFTDFENT